MRIYSIHGLTYFQIESFAQGGQETPSHTGNPVLANDSLEGPQNVIDRKIYTTFKHYLTLIRPCVDIARVRKS